MRQRILLMAVLLLPMTVLALQAWQHYQQRESGEEIILPITGFDPRDLLSGHYLIYQVDYGITESTGCPASDISSAVCLQPVRRVYPLDELPANCTLYIRGMCDHQSRFVTELERFYVPEQHAAALDKKIRDNQGKLVISVDSNGNSAIRDLLLNDQPWREIIEED